MQQTYTMVLFGEAEKGNFDIPYFCDTLAQLVDFLGNPPQESRGLFYAVQALLYRRHLIFFRVREEGYSPDDYMAGVHFLKTENLISKITAICLPGVGDLEIIQAITPLCLFYHNILITTESDFYDYIVS